MHAPGDDMVMSPIAHHLGRSLRPERFACFNSFGQDMLGSFVAGMIVALRIAASVEHHCEITISQVIVNMIASIRIAAPMRIIIL